MNNKVHSNRTVISSNDYFKIVDDYPDNPIFDISWICSRKILIILWEWHDLYWKIIASKCTDVLTIISPKWNTHWSVDLDCTKARHIKVRVLWVQGDVTIQNASRVTTRKNTWLISTRIFSREYFRVKKDI